MTMIYKETMEYSLSTFNWNQEDDESLGWKREFCGQEFDEKALNKEEHETSNCKPLKTRLWNTVEEEDTERVQKKMRKEERGESIQRLLEDFATWLEGEQSIEKRIEYSRYTVGTYTARVGTVFDYFAKEKNVKERNDFLEAICRTKNLREWLDWMKNHRYKFNTINNYAMSLNVFASYLKYLKVEGAVELKKWMKAQVIISSKKARMQSSVTNHKEHLKTQGKWVEFDEVMKAEREIKNELELRKERVLRNGGKAVKERNARNWIRNATLALTFLDGLPLRAQNFTLVMAKEPLGPVNCKENTLVISEKEGGEEEEWYMEVANYKNNKSLGYQKIPLSKELQAWYRFYLEYAWPAYFVDPPKERWGQWVFIDKEGKPIRKPGATFKRFTKLFVGGEGISASLMRKIVETALEERGGYLEGQRKQLSRSMLHSYETVKSYYLVKDSLVANRQSLEMYKEFKKNGASAPPRDKPQQESDNKAGEEKETTKEKKESEPSKEEQHEPPPPKDLLTNQNRIVTIFWNDKQTGQSQRREFEVGVNTTFKDLLLELTITMANEPPKVRARRLDVIQWLVELGVDVNVGSCNGSTALHQLTYHGSCQEIAILVDRLNADPKRCTQGGWYPLHHAYKQCKMESLKKVFVPGVDYFKARRFVEKEQEGLFWVAIQLWCD